MRSWAEIFSGYTEDPRAHLAKRFPIATDQMVSLNGIHFFSTCEHHMLPFFGYADVAYIPRDEVCGLSKLARLVNGYARRLQMQERITHDVAQAIQEELNPLGVAVRLRGQHMCMSSRGVSAEPTTVMVTTVLLGAFKSDPGARAEWLASLP